MSGRGTAAGVKFQGTVGAVFGSLLLADKSCSLIDPSLLNAPNKILFEVPDAVDDVKIETRNGVIFIQAKNAIALSETGKGDLYSAVLQFVRQYIDGIIENGSRRDLTLDRDRLVIAVPDKAPATIKEDLKTVLDRLRTGAATGLSQKLTDTRRKFEAHVCHAWFEVKGEAIRQPDLDNIVNLSSVIVIGSSQVGVSRIALSDILEQPDDDAALFGHLEKWAITSSAEGTGADLRNLRRYLAPLTVLAAPPNFKNDVRQLLNYSAENLTRLRRFSMINSKSGEFTLPREISTVIKSAAESGSFLVTGAPGAGKSGVLYNLATQLSSDSPVIVLTVDPTISSLDSMRAEVGLQNSLLSVLDAIPGNRPAYLIIDALDASRGGGAEAAYRKLIDEVSRLDDWRIIASVRTFDLQMGIEWKRLFTGIPFDKDWSDPLFPTVKHVRIPVLSNEELASAKAISPELGTVIESADEKLEPLTRNPFNLSLVSELLIAGVPENSFATIRSRQQLLEKFWEVFVAKLGTKATVALKSIIDNMLLRQAIEIPENIIEPAVAGTIDDLKREGLLADNRKGKIAFRHHILFDFSISEILLNPDRGDAMTLLKSSDGLGFLIAASVGFWLENEKANSTDFEFWKFLFDLLADPEVDPLVKVEVSRFAIETVQSTDNLSAIRPLLEEARELSIISPLSQITGAMLSHIELGKMFSVAPWVQLLSLVTVQRQDYGAVRNLLDIAINRLNFDRSNKDLGQVARQLMSTILKDDTLVQWLSPVTIAFVARTFCSDPVQSKQILASLFETPRFEKFGHIEVRNVADEVHEIAAFDPDFAVEIYRRVFKGANFSRDTPTSMSGSWILSLTSNAAQDFGMSYYSLSLRFNKILEDNPATAARALLATLSSKEEENNERRTANEIYVFKVDTREYHLREDHSSVWAWRLQEEAQYEDYAKIYTTFLNWVEAAPAETLLQILPLLLDEAQAGIIWRAIFQIAESRVDVLGKEVWHFVKSPCMILCSDTREVAVRLIASIYPSLSTEDKSQAEEDWLGADFSVFSNPEGTKISRLGILFNAIGKTNLATEDAIALLNSALDSKRTLDNEPDFRIITHRSEYSREQHLKDQGIDPNDDKAKLALSISDDVSAAIEALQEGKNKAASASLKDLITKGLEITNGTDEPLAGALEVELTDKLAGGLGSLISSELLNQEEKETAIGSLLILADSRYPEASHETEDNFAQSPSWGSPSTRIRVAQALTKNIRIEGVWQRIGPKFRAMLLQDQHPAVRYHLLNGLTNVWHINDLEFWELLGEVIKNEKNPSVLDLAAHILGRVAGIRPSDVEEMAIALLDKGVHRKRSEVQLVSLITHFALVKNYPKSNGIMNKWIASFDEYEDELKAVLLDFRNDYILGFLPEDEDGKQARHSAFDVTVRILEATKPFVEEWPLRGGGPTEKELAAVKIFTDIGEEFYYGTVHSDSFEQSLISPESRISFLNFYESMIIQLVTYGTPRSVHHVIELIEKFIPTAPERSFDLLSSALLRPAGIAKYEHETLGASLIVKIVGLYLADYRYVFDDRARRQNLIRCLSIFVDIGWPEARKLFQRLPELLH